MVIMLVLRGLESLRAMLLNKRAECADLLVVGLEHLRLRGWVSHPPSGLRRK